MIEKVKFDGFKYIDGGVCAAQGFKATEYSADWRMRERLWEKRKTILPLL